MAWLQRFTRTSPDPAPATGGATALDRAQGGVATATRGPSTSVTPSERAVAGENPDGLPVRSTPNHGDPEDAVPFALKVAAGWAWRAVIIGVAFIGLSNILSMTTAVVIPVAVALLLTTLLMPVAVLLNHKLKLPRHAAAALSVIGFLAVVIGLISLAGTQLVSGVADLTDQAGKAVTQIQDWLANGPFHVGGDQIAGYIESGRKWVDEHRGNLGTGALHAGTTATEFFAGTLIALISTFFFLAEGDRIWAWVVRMLPAAAQEPVHEGFRRGIVTLSSYVKTQCIVAAVDAVSIAIGAFIMGLPLVIPMGLIIFFGSFIPIIGSVIAGTLTVLVALFVKGPVAALIMIGVILLVQQVEGHILQPVLMSKAVAIHPLAVILGVALGSFMFGMVGALFAVPGIAVANTVISYWTGKDKFPGLAQGMSAVATSPKHLAGEADGTQDEEKAADKETAEREREIGSATPITQQDAADTQQEIAETGAQRTVADHPEDTAH